MVQYSYRPLEDPLNDIRVVHILPGSFDDEIRLNISHKSLAGIQPAAPQPAVDIESLEASLPLGWRALAVCEEWDHRVLFQDLRKATADDPITNRKASWDHPDPNFDRSVYHPLDVTLPDVGFEALSYAWGSLADPVTVKIIEGPSPSTLRITQNLACAIRHLRLMDVPRLIWIDAICIAQEDKEERAVQVQRMADIYRLANRVVIWLGEHFDDSERAIRLMQQLGESMVLRKDETWDVSPSYTAYQPQPESLWSAFKLFQRPWFSRLWVVQEASLGNRRTVIQCGHSILLRRIIRSAMAYLGGLITNVPNPAMRLYFTRLGSHVFGSSTQHSTFVSLIRSHGQRMCSDPRDKIYGLLGITGEEFRSAVLPDYFADVAKVYRDATIAEIQVSKRLNILSETFLEYHTFKCPSWVPDWSQGLQSVFKPSVPSFSSGNSMASAKLHDGEILRCRGLAYDTIDVVGETMPFTGDGQHDTQVEELIPNILIFFTERAENVSYPSQPHVLWALALALCFGVVRDRYRGAINIPKIDEVLCWMARLIQDPSIKSVRRDKIEWLQKWNRLWKHSAVSNAQCSGQPTEGLQPEQAALVECHIARCITDRSIFITKRGGIGIGPPGMQLDDEVCILLGCDLPMILRSDKGGNHQVIGSSFVAGLEDAKYLLGPLPEDMTASITWIEGQPTLFFHNTKTDTWDLEDPRLPAMDDWERHDQHTIIRSPYAVPHYKHKITGEIVKGDPRMSADALRARGVSIRSFSLI